VRSKGDLSKQFGTPVDVAKLVVDEVAALVEELGRRTEVVAVVVDIPAIVELDPDRPTML
jgi:hypothetical protein